MAILLKDDLDRTKFRNVNNSEVELARKPFFLVVLSPEVTDRAIGSQKEDFSQSIQLYVAFRNAERITLN